jgi:hypothetical protein
MAAAAPFMALANPDHGGEVREVNDAGILTSSNFSRRPALPITTRVPTLWRIAALNAPFAPRIPVAARPTMRTVQPSPMASVSE